MTRTALVRYTRWKLEPLAKDLADLIWEQVETQIAGVLEVARSALVSELEREVEALPITALAIVAPASGDRAQPPDAVEAPVGPPRRKTAKERPVIARSLPTPEPAAPSPRTPHNKGGRMICTVCHEPGHNARRHKGEQPVIVTDSTEDEDEHPARREPPVQAPAPFISKRDRFAAIEESAAKRQGSLPTPRATFHLPGGGQ